MKYKLILLGILAVGIIPLILALTSNAPADEFHSDNTTVLLNVTNNLTLANVSFYVNTIDSFNETDLECFKTGTIPNSTSETFPQTASKGNIVSGYTWNNENRIKADDGSETSIVYSFGSVESESLEATNFSFNIPSDATITGIVLKIERRADSGISDSIVKLTKDGSVGVGDNKANPFDTWFIVSRTITYGNSTDLWGTTWTPAEINNETFGAYLTVNGVFFAIGYVDYMSIQVNYTTPALGEDIGEVNCETNFTEGKYFWKANATNGTFSQELSTQVFHIDLTDPVINTIGNSYKSRDGHINISVIDNNNASTNITLDGVLIAEIDNTANLTYINTTTLALGRYNLTIVTQDLSGRTATKTKFFNVLRINEVSLYSDSNKAKIPLFADINKFITKFFGGL